MRPGVIGASSLSKSNSMHQWRRDRAISHDDYQSEFDSSIDCGVSIGQILSMSSPVSSRKTKIICAIGPACWSESQLGQLLDSGMNVARLNFSHGDHAIHQKSLGNLRAAIAKRRKRNSDCHCAVLMDTKGPEIRTGFLANPPLALHKGQEISISTLDYDSTKGDATIGMTCSYAHLATSVKVGGTILCDDGSITLKVVRILDDLTGIVVEVLNDCLLEECKNMNLPGASINIPGITEKDKYDLEHFAIPNDVDIVSGSFVRSAANVRSIRDALGKRHRNIRVHAKIESIEALRNIDEIISEADGVHVSRGDLGMELQPEQVFLAQKMIIRKANLAGKPVVTSTQMLQSMTRRPTPSSAECSDVANAVLDGTDVVMLSAETAKGMYPVEAVQTMARILVEAESSLNFNMIYRLTRKATLKPVSIAEAVASSAVETSLDLNAKLIISFSETGKSATYIAKYRPQARILVVTASGSTARQMASLSRGVSSIHVGSMIGTDSLIIRSIAYAKDRKWVNNGDFVVVLHGEREGTAGKTNIVKIIEVSSSGYSSPTNYRQIRGIPYICD